MKRILYIQVGSGFKNPNKHIISQLHLHFPEIEIELIDVLEIVKKNYFILLVNTLVMLREYAFDFLVYNKNVFKFRTHFLGTTFLFKHFTKLVNEKVATGEYDLIFQTQCMCDASNQKGIPVIIYTDHTNLNNLNYFNIKTSEFLHSNRYINLERKAYENAKAIFVMSNNIKTSLVEQYKIESEKIKLVYVGANITVEKELQSNGKYSNKNILFVGKDWKRKGGPLLVEAFKIVQRQIPDAMLTIVGCSPRIQSRNSVIKGEISLEEVAEEYNKASVFCMPTIREPFGIVFLEAMFNRLPVVTNDTGATRYLVKTGENGYLLKHNAEEYAKVLIELLNDPDRCEKFGNRSYSIAAENYTWTNVGNLMAKHIREHVGFSNS